MPLALFAATPPIMQVLIEAGSGPIFTRQGSRNELTWDAMTPGSTATRRASSRTRMRFHAWEMSTRIPSVTACPESDVPAARKVR